MDTQKLRQRILDLAIRGKLVPQDPNDEPASVLLDRIRAEKECLIAEGKIKRPKAKKSTDTSHYQQFTPPFDIPDSWQWVRLEEIGDIVTGSTPSKSDTSNYGYDYPFYKPNDLEQGLNTIKANDNLSAKGLALARVLPVGSVLVTCIGATIGKTGLIRTSGASNQQINAIIPNIVVDSEYLYHVIIGEYFQNLIKQNASSTTLPILNKGDFSKLLIPIPPQDEQKRIIKSIKSLFNIISVIDVATSSIKDLVKVAKSKILDLAMQGKLVPQDPADEPAADMLRRINPKARIITDNPHSWNIPNSWTWCQLGDIFHHNTGKTLSSSNRDGIEYEYITTSNVYWNRFELDDLKKMPFKENELEKCTVRHGDLLVCEGGDVGRSAIWNLDRNIMIQNHLHRLRPIANEIHTSLYYHVFRLYKYKDLIGGKGIALQGFSSKSLHQLVIPLPPANEQKHIVAKIEELYSVLDDIEASLRS